LPGPGHPNEDRYALRPPRQNRKVYRPLVDRRMLAVDHQEVRAGLAQDLDHVRRRRLDEAADKRSPALQQRFEIRNLSPSPSRAAAITPLRLVYPTQLSSELSLSRGYSNVTRVES
jgi:hypothetical protein